MKIYFVCIRIMIHNLIYAFTRNGHKMNQRNDQIEQTDCSSSGGELRIATTVMKVISSKSI